MNGTQGAVNRAYVRRLTSACASAFLLGGLLFHSLTVRAQETVKVLSFTPQGEVKGVRQARATFSEPMIAFGDPRARETSPFTVECSNPKAASGTPLWSDSANWVFNFTEDLPAGIRCSFKVKPGMKAVSGRVIPALTFTFSTGGPAVRSSRPWEGSESVHEEQAFVLTLDAPAIPASVLKHASFSVSGQGDPVPVRLIEGKTRDEILKAAYVAAGPHVLVLQAKQKFPASTTITLNWGAGISTLSGVATSTSQNLPFRTRPVFTVKMSCERENADAPCIPFRPVVLSFASEVAWKELQKAEIRGPGGKVWKPVPPKDVKDDHFQSGITFNGPFPEDAQLTITIPSGLKDMDGRPLTNQASFPLVFKTGENPPLVKFTGHFGILESKPEGVLPVTVRNVESALAGERMEITGQMLSMRSPDVSEIATWIRKVQRDTFDNSYRSVPILDSKTKTHDFKLPKPNGARAFEVIGIPLKKPGFHVVELASPKLGASLLGTDQTMYVRTSVLVTNLAVHFKEGREASLVWVTSLDQAKPVAGAKVSVRTCEGEMLAEGVTDAQGVLQISKSLKGSKTRSCNIPGFSGYGSGDGDGDGNGLFVTATKGDDFSFVHSNWNDGISRWQFQVGQSYPPRPNIAHTVFDRSLFRAGQKVHMKHLIRRHTMNAMTRVPPEDRPAGLRIEHQGSNQKYVFPLKWVGDDVSTSEWTIPKGAKLGTYQVYLTKTYEAPKGDNTGSEAAALENTGDSEEGEGGYHRYQSYSSTDWPSGSFRVEEFRVPLMKAQIAPPSGTLIAPKEIPLNLSAQYLAGGGATKLPVKIRYQTQSRGASAFPKFEGFVFGNGTMPRKESSDESDSAGGAKKPDLKEEILTLDSAGTGKAVLQAEASIEKPTQLFAEMEYRDPNGEIQTTSVTVPLWSADRLVGLKTDSWASAEKSVKFQVAVADLQGAPQAGVPVEVRAYVQKVYSNRKKLVGGFYAYDSRTELKDLGQVCKTKTGSNGSARCEGSLSEGGHVYLEARAEDGKGRPTRAYLSTWVSDGKGWWFEQGESDRIDVLPEQKRYEPGQTAKFQVRMPFREATALVAIEREGVMDHKVVTLKGEKPVIEVPVLRNHAPNIYVSVLAIRGRVDAPAATALVDLAKPAFKMGIGEIQVGWKPHELKVTVQSDREVYQVRQKAKVKVAVIRAEDGKPAAGGEVILAAVDEGLLQLKKNESWDLLEAMMGRRGYEVDTATAQMQVIGKRHFGLKAVPTGGGGGRTTTRELFDTLLIWQASVKLDEKGEAEVTVPLNDSVTSFRIVGVAHSAFDRFGKGETTIRSTQDLMILPGVPPLAREGDQFPAEFTLRNTTREAMSVETGLKLNGQAMLAQKISLAPDEAKVVRWKITVPEGISTLVYEVSASAKKAADRVRITQAVVPAVPVRVLQATIRQLEGATQEPVKLPEGAIAGRGSVRVVLDSSLIAGLSGAQEYMRKYPYTCLEQSSSRAIALQDHAAWKGIMEELPSYLDGQGFAKYFPGSGRGSDVLTVYLLQISNEQGWPIPVGSRKRMKDALRGFLEGKITLGSDLPTANLSHRKLAAAAALARDGDLKWSEMGWLKVQPNLWPTSALLDWWTVLRYAKEVPQGTQLAEMLQILRSRLNFQGTIMTFSTEAQDFLWWFMVSVDSNANRLLLLALDQPEWKADMPRLVRGAFSRMKRGHWDTTVANAWGVVAMTRFAGVFEKTPVGGMTSAVLADEKASLDWAKRPKGDFLDLKWPAQAAQLKVSHQGSGKPWVMLQSRAALPLKEPLWSGYRVKRTLTAVERKKKDQWSKGDILRVRLDINAQTDMTWVVVNDPIPAGASILGSGLGNDSALATQGEKSTGWWGPEFIERRFDAYRSYYRYVPKGDFTVEYTVRLNQDGMMNLPLSRVEAMYAPEMFGELPGGTFRIEE